MHHTHPTWLWYCSLSSSTQQTNHGVSCNYNTPIPKWCHFAGNIALHQTQCRQFPHTNTQMHSTTHYMHPTWLWYWYSDLHISTSTHQPTIECHAIQCNDHNKARFFCKSWIVSATLKTLLADHASTHPQHGQSRDNQPADNICCLLPQDHTTSPD